MEDAEERAIAFAEPDTAGWVMAWEVLGSERCGPLLGFLVAPTGMAARPGRLRAAAQQALEAQTEGLPGVPGGRGPLDAGFHAAYERAFRALLAAFFGALVA